MGADLESRVAKLEGRHAQFGQMIEELYQDWNDLRTKLDEAKRELRVARHTAREAARRKNDAETDYAILESLSLLAEREKGKDGKLGGANAEIRKDQQAALVAELQKGQLKGAYDAMVGAQKAHEAAQVELECCLDDFSAIRYAARITGDLARSLGG